MKVSIGMNLQPGPWGGGNQFGHALATHLRSRHIQVCFDLAAADIDIILLTEPRRELRICAYNEYDIVRYLLRTRRPAVVVHRVNECDERKGTSGVNQRLRRANRCADYTVFVSEWLRSLHLRQSFPCREHQVIRNGSDRSVFSSEAYRPWDGTAPLKLVTHHWSSNPMKGFDIYRRLDGLLASDAFKDKIAFTYIGNLPEGFRFQHVNYHEPLHGLELARLLGQHHVYVSASQHEPGPNHQNEGACCGLPLLYRQSGALPEYCEGFGISFTEENFEAKLLEMMATYKQWAGGMSRFPYSADRMCEQYEALFRELRNRSAELARHRKWWRRPLWLLQMLFRNA